MPAHPGRSFREQREKALNVVEHMHCSPGSDACSNVAAWRAITGSLRLYGWLSCPRPDAHRDQAARGLRSHRGIDGTPAPDGAGCTVRSPSPWRCRPVAGVIVAPPLRLTGSHRRHRLAAVECLILGFFVNAEHDEHARRVHNAARQHPLPLATKSGSVKGLNVPCRCGFRPKALDPLHPADRQAAVLCHATRTPMCRAGRLAIQRAGDQRLVPRILDRSGRRVAVRREGPRLAGPESAGAFCRLSWRVC